jgi:hypothetical protein
MTINPPNAIHQQFNPGQPYQIIYVKEPERSLQHYPVRHSVALGVAQIICGAACIILGGCAIGNKATLNFVGYGIWGGICPIIAGALGIAAACQKSKGLIAANLVMSIIAAFFISAPFCLAISSAAIDSDIPYSDGYDPTRYTSYYDRYYYGSSYSNRISPSERSSRLAVDGLLVIFAGLEVIIAIWSSGIACNFCCCCRCCWSCCCTCYNKEGNAVTSMDLPTILMQVQGQQYPGQVVMIQSANPQNVAASGYNPNAIGFSPAMQPPSYTVNPDQAPPFLPKY